MQMSEAYHFMEKLRLKVAESAGTISYGVLPFFPVERRLPPENQ